ncbi:dual specificity protein phosphatase PHS1 isoform X1 [Triticum urartu]|uniref:Dual specificity protein phosphatase PHS1 n=1 Tax=Triticum urartu TaxID=4572 RepID=A0A8R7P7M4_TRIUA|nr:dual specificity protein phosphatase PHS1 isoform X1 [Triticum urartu]
MEQGAARQDEARKEREAPPPVPFPRENLERDLKLPSRVVSLFFGGDISTTAQSFEKWVSLVRLRSGTFRPSGFPRRNSRIEVMPSGSFSLFGSADLREEVVKAEAASREKNPTLDQPPEISLWERLGNASALDIESSGFSWNMLSSLHHTEHSSSSEHSEDEMTKALEMTVNSGGVVFFALFSAGNNGLPKEEAAVIKFAASKMATQAELLGYEFARLLGVQTPQARIVHNSSLEWQGIKHAAEKAREIAVSNNDEIGEMTCSELLEALELSRCLLLMSYFHGSPLLESPKAFSSRQAACITSSSLGRVLMLDLILRNEDRLPCRQLGWRGNPANLMISDRSSLPSMDRFEESKGTLENSNPLFSNIFQKEKQFHSANGRLDSPEVDLMSGKADALRSVQENAESASGTFHIVAIDTGVPRRPPAGRRVKDHERYPKVVELILNNSDHSANILYEISGGKLGIPGPDEAITSTDSCCSLSDEDNAAAIHEFRVAFRAALRDLEGFHLFLLQLYQKLDGVLRVFSSIITKSSEESDHNDIAISDFPSPGASYSTPCPPNKHVNSDPHSDSGTQKNATKTSSAGSRGSSDSPMSRDSWSGKHLKGSADAPRSRMTMRLRDFYKTPKVDVDPELLKEIEQWNEAFKTDVIRFCQENNFHSGFFDGTENNMAADAYELKVRLEHIIERTSLVSDAANTERPSLVVNNLFIGGALAARSKYTLQHLGITHILCLCSNEIGQSDTQFPDLFQYKNFSISDDDDANISDLFEEASDFIDQVDRVGGKVLIHCFEGKSRSATVVLAYLMLRKGFTLAKAWNLLKKVHRRAQPNDGFAKALLALDKKLHGKASMDWQQKRPEMKVCPICGKNVGLSTSSLKLHLQKAHRRLSQGSVDSAMTMEIQKSIESLRISRGGSLSPSQKLAKAFADELTF